MTRDSAVLRVWRHPPSPLCVQHGIRRRWGSAGATLIDTSAPPSVTAFRADPAEEAEEEDEAAVLKEEEDKRIKRCRRRRSDKRHQLRSEAGDGGVLGPEPIKHGQNRAAHGRKPQPPRLPRLPLQETWRNRTALRRRQFVTTGGETEKMSEDTRPDEWVLHGNQRPHRCDIESVCALITWMWSDADMQSKVGDEEPPPHLPPLISSTWGREGKQVWGWRQVWG